VTFRDDAVRALRAGQNADIGDPNPYNPSNPTLAKVWMRGFRTNLTIRCAATPAMQTYLRARAEPEQSSTGLG
jgi:hypothetical protein